MTIIFKKMAHKSSKCSYLAGIGRENRFKFSAVVAVDFLGSTSLGRLNARFDVVTRGDPNRLARGRRARTRPLAMSHPGTFWLYRAVEIAGWVKDLCVDRAEMILAPIRFQRWSQNSTRAQQTTRERRQLIPRKLHQSPRE